MIVLGIDPGTYGGWALWRNGTVVEVGDSPTVVAKTGRQVPDLDAMCSLAERVGSSVLVIEQQWAQRDNGKQGCFASGFSYGAWCMVAIAHDCPLRIVSPQRWKASYAVAPGDKDAYRQLALSLWPHLPLTRKKDGHRADAALIAAWGASTMDQDRAESRSRPRKRLARPTGATYPTAGGLA